MTHRPMLLIALFALVAAAPIVPAHAQPLPSALLHGGQAPDSFLVVFETTKGRVVLKAHRDWAPAGADRLYELARGRFYDGEVIYRVGPTATFAGGFVAQFGVANSAAVNAAWEKASIADEPVRVGNRRGTVSFARGGPRTRSVELGFNLAANAPLDTVTYEGIVGFPPVAEVVQGMAVLDSLNRRYGNAVFDHFDSVTAMGRAYLDRAYPGLDRVLKVSVSKSWQGRRR